MSIISVSPTSLDLGECILGQLKSATFTVKNESDMTALVLPYVDSKSLEVLEKELSIPPRSSKPCHVEYVARNADAFYANKIFVMNVFNSHCNVDIEVRAKNVDVNGIMELSTLYQIYTQNQKMQTQVYFDKCLWNAPNLRTFCIKNMGSESLQFEFSTSSLATVQVYLWNKDVLLNEDRIGHTMKKWGGALEKETKLLSSTRRFWNRTVDDEAIHTMSFSGRDKFSDLGDWPREEYRPDEGIEEKRSYSGHDAASHQKSLVERYAVENVFPPSQFVQLMGTDGFPFSLLDSGENGSVATVIGDAASAPTGERREVDNVTRIHKCYDDFRRVRYICIKILACVSD